MNLLPNDFPPCPQPEDLSPLSYILPTGNENHLALQMDVTQQSTVESVIATARDRFGEPPSLLVNSAGVPDRCSIVDLTEDKIDTVMNVNLKVVFLTVPKAI